MHGPRRAQGWDPASSGHPPEGEGWPQSDPREAREGIERSGRPSTAWPVPSPRNLNPRVRRRHRHEDPVAGVGTSRWIGHTKIVTGLPQRRPPAEGMLLDGNSRDARRRLIGAGRWPEP
jgi:hypothetical protein